MAPLPQETLPNGHHIDKIGFYPREGRYRVVVVVVVVGVVSVVVYNK